MTNDNTFTTDDQGYEMFEEFYNSANPTWAALLIQVIKDIDNDMAARPTDEEAEDLVNKLLGGGDKISTTYDDANSTLTIDTSALDSEEVDDQVAGLLTAGDKLTLSYDDANDALQIDTSALDAEEVRDEVGQLLAAGNAIGVTVDDAADTVTIAVDESTISHDNLSGISKGDHRTDEQIEDLVAQLLAAGDKLSITHDDAGDTITIDTSALDTEEVEDAVAQLVVGGSGIGVSYDDAGDSLTLSIPDNSVTASMLVEAYYTQSEADNRFYNVSGDTLGGDIDYGNFEGQNAGKDGVRVPSSREGLTVADFESGTLPQDAVGDTGSQSTVQTSVVESGSYALELAGADKDAEITFPSRSVQPQAGDSFSYSAYLTDTDDLHLTYIAQQSLVEPTGNSNYRVNLDASGDALAFEKDDTNDIASASAPISSHLNEWLTVSVDWGTDGAFSIVLLDSTGTQLASLSGTDKSYDSGYIAFQAFNNTTKSPTQYWDSWTLTRRTPEYYSNTKNGVTELGNEVTPSGAINTGPQEAPLNASRQVYAHAPVNDSATQGTTSYLTLLQSGLDPTAYVERVLDGQGGAYGHQLQTALGRFARLNANLSWEYESLADVPSWSSGDGGTSVWTFNINGRPRRIHVEHDGSGGSDDQGGLVTTSLTTYQSLGGFSITFHDVSYTDNAAGNFPSLGVSDVEPSNSAWNTGNGFFFVDQLLQTVSGGTAASTTVSVDWATNHDITLEYDGAEVRLYVDGVLLGTKAYSANADFSPIVQLKEESSNSSSEVLEVEQITVEPLAEVLQ